MDLIKVNLGKHNSSEPKLPRPLGRGLIDTQSALAETVIIEFSYNNFWLKPNTYKIIHDLKVVAIGRNIKIKCKKEHT